MSDHALDAVHAADHSPRRPPWAAAAWRQYRLERRMFWRNPTAAFFGFLLPLLLLAMFGALFSGHQDDLDVVVPGIAGMSVMAATFVALAYNLTFLRERGILKRLRGTPLPSSAYLAGIAANAITNTVLQIAVVIVAGRAVLRHPVAGRLVRAAGVPGRRRDLLRLARRGALARDPQLRVGARVRERGVPADDHARGRLLRRRGRAARCCATSPRRCRSST